jgi:hypothetical protein
MERAPEGDNAERLPSILLWELEQSSAVELPQTSLAHQTKAACMFFARLLRPLRSEVIDFTNGARLRSARDGECCAMMYGFWSRETDH